jgi:hypothetical protein
MDRQEAMIMEGLRGLELAWQAYREMIWERYASGLDLAEELRRVEENLAEARLPLHQCLQWLAENRGLGTTRT